MSTASYQQSVNQKSVKMETFASRLKLVMGQKNIRYKSEIADMMGISRQSVHKYFDEEKPTLPQKDNAIALCNKLKINYDWLMYGTGPEFKPQPKTKTSKYVNSKVEPMQVSEPSSTMMDIRAVLETYYKEIDLIKDMLNLKQSAYGKVIFPD